MKVLVEVVSDSKTHTSPTLLSQVRDPDNHDAWYRFDAKYRPMIMHFCRTRFSMSQDQADEAAQSVLVKLVGNMRKFRYDRNQNFRGWLSRITRNTVINSLQRGPQDKAAGGSEVGEMLHSVPQSSAQELEGRLSLELMRSLFEECEDSIKKRITEQTWNAFVMLRGGTKGEQVAEALGMHVGAVYRAKTRVMNFFRDEIAKRLKESDDE